MPENHAINNWVEEAHPHHPEKTIQQLRTDVGNRLDDFRKEPRADNLQCARALIRSTKQDIAAWESGSTAEDNDKNAVLTAAAYLADLPLYVMASDPPLTWDEIGTNREEYLGMYAAIYDIIATKKIPAWKDPN